MITLSKLTTLITDSLRNVRFSGTTYAAVDLATVDYRPAKVFKGIHLNTEGDVRIEGLDGVAQTFTGLQPGPYAYGGKAILKTGTTATLIAIR